MESEAEETISGTALLRAVSYTLKERDWSEAELPGVAAVVALIDRMSEEFALAMSRISSTADEKEVPDSKE